MTDFNQSRFDTIKKIKDHFNDVARSVLDDLFDHALVGDDIEKARQVASLLEKINSSEEANLPDPLLLEGLKDEKKRNTLAYQVIITKRRVSGDNYVEFAIKKLTELEEKYSSYSNLKRDISLLKVALSEKKTELAKVLEVEKKFAVIETEILKLVKEGEKNDRQTKALTKNITNIEAELVVLKAREAAIKGKTDPEWITFNEYKTVIDRLLKSVTDDVNKDNKYDARLSIGNTSITGSELRCNILFNFIKEYFENLNPAEVYTYLKGKKVTMAINEADQKRMFDSIVKYTKDVAIPKSDKDSDLYKTEEDEKLLENHYFRRLHDSEASRRKKKTIWEVSKKFGNEKLIFPYRDFFALMKDWFKDGVGDGTIRSNDYPAFINEDTNPFKKAGLLNKEFELVFDPTDETSKKTYIGENANNWYVNNPTKRTSVKFNNLQDALIEFYSFFPSGTTGNESTFLATTAAASWQVLASGNEYQEGFVPTNAKDLGLIGDILGLHKHQLIEDPMLALQEYLKKRDNDKKIADKSVEAYNSRRIEKVDLPIIDQLDKLDPLQESLKAIKQTALEDLLNKAREFYKVTNNGVDLKLLTDDKIDSIIYYLNEVKQFKGSLETSDKAILDKVTQFRSQVDGKAISWKNYKALKGDTFEERLKDLRFDAQYARNLHNDFQTLKGIITLDKEQNKVLEKLSAVIARLDKGDKWEDIRGSDAPNDTPALTKLEIQDTFVAVLGADAKPNDTIAETWTKFNNTKSELSTVENIKQFIETKIKDKKTDFLSHIDGNLPDADKPAADDSEDKRVASFVSSKSAETVIKAVISHEIETEDEKKKIVKRMKADKDDEKPLDMSKYGTNPGTIEEPKDGAVIEYRYREITGKDQEHKKGSENDKNNQKKGFIDKYLAPGFYAPIWVLTLLVGLAIFYFWDNISNWWNGPAEEGELTEEEEK